jgi:hypothetical protein
MSIDPSIAAFARPDAAAAESQLLAAAQALDVAELIAALGQVGALLAGAPEGSEGSAAIERIADIAFVLHEREVEHSLCDALDAAVREIGAADAVKRASMERAREAAALLRELTHALNEILAMAAVEQQPQPAAIVVEAPPSPNSVQTVQDSPDAEAGEQDELAPPTGLFDADMPPDDAFAATVVTLADALPEAVGAAPADSQPQMPEPFAASETLTHSQSELGANEDTGGVFQPEDITVSHCSAEQDLREEVSEGQPVAAVNADPGAEASQYTVPPEAFLNEPAAAGPERLETDESSGEQTTTSAADCAQGPPVAELTETGPVDAAAPVAPHEEAPVQDEQSAVFSDVAPEPAASRPAIDPNEDPDELFEPAAELPLPSIAPAPAAIAPPSGDGEAALASIPLAASPAAPAASALAAAQTQPAPASALRLPLVAPVDEASQPPASDPLAPIRALSEEELIALFG